MEESKKVGFKIDGEFICTIARSWFWEEDRPLQKCEELLLACLDGNEIALEEKKQIVVEILEGRKKLVGVNTCKLVDDNEYIRPLGMKIAEYEKRQAIEDIKKHIETYPILYVDKYATDKRIEDIEKYTDTRKWLVESSPFAVKDEQLTEREYIRRYLYSSVNVWIRKAWLLDGYYNGERPLDNGLYLMDNPNLIYELIGKPINGDNEDLLYKRLFEYWENKKDKSNQVRIRQEKYLADLRMNEQKSKVLQEEVEQQEEQYNKLYNRTIPDKFLSEYGLIDREGNWYSCGFGGHETKAYNYVLRYKQEFNFKQGERIRNAGDTLDILVNAGWIVLRNPYPGGSAFIYCKEDIRATKAQVNTVFDYMMHFNLKVLSGLEKIIE